ncbi:MAG: DUF4423 domain-containing protein [Oligoflexales bacterium]
MRIIINNQGIDNDYRLILKDTMSFMKEVKPESYKLKYLAHACGIKPAYLSLALSLKTHLSLDQLWGACEFLQLDSKEQDFLEALANYQQSKKPGRQNNLKEKVLEAEKHLFDITNIVPPPSRETPDWFHLDMTAQLVRQFISSHSGTAIDHLTLQKHLGCSHSKLQTTLRKLISHKLIHKKDESNTYTCSNLQAHLPKDSYLFPAFFRSRLAFALDQAERNEQESEVSFSVMFTSNSTFQSQLKQKINALISWSQKEVQKHDQKDVYALNIHSSKLTRSY